MKETSVDAPVAAVSSELDSSVSLKEEQKMILRAFLDGQHVYTLHLNGADWWESLLMSPLALTGSLELLLPG